MSLRRWLADHFRSTPPNDAHAQLEELTRFVIARGLRLPHYDDLTRSLEVRQTHRRGSELLTLEKLELYAGGFLLRFHLQGGWQQWWVDLRARKLRVEAPSVGAIFVEDDRGSEYRAALRSSRPGEAEYGGLPAIAEGATRLFVTVRREGANNTTFEIDLDS